MKRTFSVVIEKDADGGFVASVVELPGCHTQADSIEEIRVNIVEAIELYLEGGDVPDTLPQFVGVERVEVHV